MTTATFSHVVSSKDELRAIIGMPSEVAIRKQIAALDEHCRAFIAQSPFVLVGTSNAEGRCDVSPRGDGPGFVMVLEDGMLLIPERPGNRRVDTLLNIIENPRVGLLFLIPGIEETLRVNGRAAIIRDPDLLERMAVQGKTPLLATAVEVDEAFIHCAKAFKRSRLWDEDARPPRSAVPSLARMAIDHAQIPNCTVEELEEALEKDYKRLY
jgi:uncharacterized protein